MICCSADPGILELIKHQPVITAQLPVLLAIFFKDMWIRFPRHHTVGFCKEHLYKRQCSMASGVAVWAEIVQQDVV